MNAQVKESNKNVQVPFTSTEVRNLSKILNEHKNYALIIKNQQKEIATMQAQIDISSQQLSVVDEQKNNLSTINTELVKMYQHEKQQKRKYKWWAIGATVAAGLVLVVK